jgi:Holliday junction DNA helicase RuvA
VRVSRAHLDEDQRPVDAAHDVDLAHLFVREIAVQYLVSAHFQEVGGNLFTRTTGFYSIHEKIFRYSRPMIAQLSGTVAHKHGMDVVIDCHGVGYAVSVPLSTADTVPAIGERVTLFTTLVVREDAMQLYGFASTSERETFALLTSIQGIGPRTALGILSASSIADLRKAVATSNVVALTRLPGIGKKTAERLVIELREKIISVVPDSSGSISVSATPAIDDAVSALQALGFARAAAEKAVKAAIAAEPSASESSEKLIRLALRQTS